MCGALLLGCSALAKNSSAAGRLINGYSRKDWLLFAVYRGTNGFLKTPAGLCPAPFTGKRVRHAASTNAR